MDQATILKILENHGAPPTQENINRVMQQSGRGTELLGRSMGLQGGMDESGPGMDLILDKHMQSTGRSGIAPNTEPQINPDSMSDGAASNGSARGRSVVRPARGMAVNTEPPPGSRPPDLTDPFYRGGSGTVVQDVDRNMNGTPNVLDGSITRGYQNETANRDAANRPLGGDDSSGLNWLLAALGLTAAGASMRGGVPINNPPQITGPNAPAQIEGANPNQLEDQDYARRQGRRPTEYPSGAPIIPKQKPGDPAAPQTPDDVAKMKAQVDAERAVFEAEQAEKNKSNANARGKGAGAGRAPLTDAQKTFEAAKKLFRR